MNEMKLDAMNDAINERAWEIIFEGEYDQYVEEDILNGKYDATVLKHITNITLSLERTLRIMRTASLYEEMWVSGKLNMLKEIKGLLNE